MSLEVSGNPKTIVQMASYYALPYNDSSPRCPGMRGDLVIFKRRVGYYYYAVNVGNGEIVHRTAIDGSGSVDVLDGLRLASSANSGFAIIRKEKFRDFWKLGDTVEVENSQTSLSCDEIVFRALSRVGEKGYSLLWENCEHFAC